MTPFGRWLAGELERRGWTDNHFATTIGLDRRYVNRWLYYDLPKPDKCAAIADGLDVPLWIVYEAAGFPFRGLQGLSDESLVDLRAWLSERGKRI